MRQNVRPAQCEKITPNALCLLHCNRWFGPAPAATAFVTEDEVLRLRRFAFAKQNSDRWQSIAISLLSSLQVFGPVLAATTFVTEREALLESTGFDAADPLTVLLY